MKRTICFLSLSSLIVRVANYIESIATGLQNKFTWDKNTNWVRQGMVLSVGESDSQTTAVLSVQLIEIQLCALSSNTAISRLPWVVPNVHYVVKTQSCLVYSNLPWCIRYNIITPFGHGFLWFMTHIVNVYSNRNLPTSTCLWQVSAKVFIVTHRL